MDFGEKKDKEDSSIISSKPSSESHGKGLSLPIASVFIVGEMAGSGVLALPEAIKNAGWSGVPLLVLCCLNTLYAGICLGRCWTIIEERYDEYKAEKNRYPYAAIAYRAYGKHMRYVVSFCNDFTLFGVATVFLLLASQLIGNLASKWGISFCYWILILAVILCPLMWLGTPDDFWPAAIGALGTTVVACVLLVVAIAKGGTGHHVDYPPPDVKSFFLAFGTILFAFGGASTFPTFQNDMRDRSDFPKAATIGFGVLICLYLPVSVLGYAVYGSDLKDNVINSLPESGLKIAIEVLLALHLFCAFLLVINTPAQEFEEFFRVPKSFGWKRVALRSAMMVTIVFVAQSIPRFGKVLDLVGGSTTTLTTAVFPCFFYLKLCSQEDPQWPRRQIPLYQKIYLYQIMILGVIGGGIATYAAIEQIVKPGSFSPPCYVNITAAGMQ